MAGTRIAGALVVVVLTSCSVEEPVQSPRVTPVTTAKTSAAANAGLRADFNAP
jgi:phosphoribosylcarboxyaminoimidazole (NCAIR) mutase